MDLQDKLKQLVEVEFEEVLVEKEMLICVGNKFGKRKDFQQVKMNFDQEFKEGKPIWLMDCPEYFQSKLAVPFPESDRGVLAHNELFELTKEPLLGTQVVVQKKIEKTPAFKKREIRCHTQTEINFIELEPNKFQPKEQKEPAFKKILELVNTKTKRKPRKKPKTEL